jgi:hypothetical protein
VAESLAISLVVHNSHTRDGMSGTQYRSISAALELPSTDELRNSRDAY